jgi:hypothetical protein
MECNFVILIHGIFFHRRLPCNISKHANERIAWKIFNVNERMAGFKAEVGLLAAGVGARAVAGVGGDDDMFVESW